MSSNTENPCDPKRSIEQHTGMLPRPAPEAAATSDTSQFNMDTNNPATSDILEGVIVEEILKAQMSQPVSVVVSFPHSTEKKRAERSSFTTDKPGSPPLKEGGGAARRPRRVPVALEPTDETSHVGHTGRGSICASRRKRIAGAFRVHAAYRSTVRGTFPRLRITNRKETRVSTACPPCG